MDTSRLINIGSKLSSIRDMIQKQLLRRFEHDKPVVIINAPTGSGKTKVFLDLINHYKSTNKNLERVFYFSPLLPYFVYIFSNAATFSFNKFPLLSYILVKLARIDKFPFLSKNLIL